MCLSCVFEANAVFVALQSLKSLLSAQRERLQALVTTNCTIMQMEGPFGESRVLEKNPATHSIKGSFVESHSHERLCLDCVLCCLPEALGRMDKFPEF